MAKVLCFGSLNIDYVYKVDHIVEKGETISSKSLNLYSGGKGLNQSCALGKAGCQVYHAGMIGQDGAFLLEVLKESKVDVSFVTVSETERTGNAIIQNDAEGDNCIILYPGANRAITEEMVDAVFEYFCEGDYLILQNEINELSYITKKANEMGIITVLNPSPFDEKLTDEILGRVNWLILNEIEAMQVTGCESDQEAELARALIKKYPDKKFVLTLGKNGSCYIDCEQQIPQGIFKVETVDTTAAGDTYTGYFISGLLKGWDLAKCLKVAAKASSIAVSRPGASPSIPWMEEVLGALEV